MQVSSRQFIGNPINCMTDSMSSGTDRPICLKGIVPRDTTGFHEAASSRPLKCCQFTAVNDAAMKNRCSLNKA